jgi:phosphatidate cytidylyltransferase
MLLTRALAALIFAPLFFLAIHFDSLSTWPLFALCLIVAFFGLWEYFAMAAPKHLSDRIVGQVVGLALATATMLGFVQTAHWPLILPAVAIIAICAVVFNPLPLEEGIKRSAALTLGIVYGGLLISYLYLLRQGNDGRFWAMSAIFSVWCCDTGAYFAGRTLGRSGKHKFAPNLSPKKSWEGFFGGIISAMLLMLLTHYIYAPAFSFWVALILGAVAGIMGPIGDSAESLLKRSAGVKDSGKIIPGHGGVLDRFDAVIFVTPVFYIIRALFF